MQERDVHEITLQQIEVARIERDFGVSTPNFISEQPKIDPNEAADFAIKNNLMHEESWQDEEENYMRRYASLRGLQYCRVRNISLEQAQSKIEIEAPLSKKDLYERFSPEKEKETREQTTYLEQQRRLKRDNEILKFEKSLLEKRGIQVASDMTDLISYCKYFSDQRNREFDEDCSPEDIYWNLMAHYGKLIEGAERGFDPLGEWRAHLEGKINVAKYKYWDIQNIGDKDFSYYDYVQTYGSYNLPTNIDYKSGLLFHATSLDVANNSVRNGSLHPKVCMSAGQTLSNRYAVAFIFDKQTIQDNYSARPYVESYGNHEREIRSYEQISLDFCIGCVPVTKEIFPDEYLESFYYPEQPIGRITSDKWEENLRTTGELWTEEDREKIKREIKRLETK